MSMEVKRDEPLSPAARQYLFDRGQHDLIAQIDEKYPPKRGTQVVSPAYGPGHNPNPTGVESMDTAALLEELRRRQAGGEDLSDYADATEADEIPYEQWTSDELNEELSERTGQDGKPLSKSGTNAQKAARLRENDAYLASQEQKPL